MDDKIDDNLQTANPNTQVKNEVKPIEHTKDKRRSKEEKNRKKDERKAADQVSRCFNAVQNLEEKLDIMCRKYTDIVEESKKLQLMLKQSEKKILMLQREKEQFQNDRSKAILMRRRLESLCRELQKQNKAVKEESLLRLREEEDKRKEVSAKFQSTLAEISALMNQNLEKNAKMQEDNLEMNRKFRTVYEQVELKEQQLLQVHTQMKLDLYVAHAKLEKVKIDATAEKEALLKERQQLLFKLTECQTQIRELQVTEIALRSQISMYTDKYDEFQNALTNSNKVYGEFNEEMEKMSKKILTLEKETNLWKQQWENSHAALLEMEANSRVREVEITAYKEARDTEVATLTKKLSLLQDLCKVFQRERTSLLAQLKENGETSQSDKNTENNNAKIQENIKSTEQVDKLSNDCLALQSSFGQLHACLSKVSDVIQKGLEEESVRNAMEEQSSTVSDNAMKSSKNDTKSSSPHSDNEVDPENIRTGVTIVECPNITKTDEEEHCERIDIIEFDVSGSDECDQEEKCLLHYPENLKKENMRNEAEKFKIKNDCVNDLSFDEVNLINPDDECKTENMITGASITIPENDSELEIELNKITQINTPYEYIKDISETSDVECTNIETVLNDVLTNETNVKKSIDIATEIVENNIKSESMNILTAEENSSIRNFNETETILDNVENTN